MNRFSRSRGFTLIEILIALFIFTIISAILAMVLRQVLTTRETLRATQKRLNEISLAELLLHRDLTQVVLTSIILNQQVQSPVEGEEHEIVVFRGGEVNPFAMSSRSTLLEVHYFLREGQWIRQTKALFSASDEIQEEVILQQVRSVQFRYIGPDRHFYAVWPRAQTKNEESPIGIEVTLTLQGLGSVKQTIVVGGFSS